MPAISTNAYGDISTIFTGSSTSVTANLMFAGRTVADAAGAMGLPQVLESSANSNYTSGRWGDYFGVDVDPVDDLHFWGIGMSVNATNGWRTSIFKWRISAIPSQLVVSPSSVAPGETSSVTVSLTSPAGPGGVVLNIKMSPKSAARVASTLTIPEGSISGTVTVQVYPFHPPGTLNITVNNNRNLLTGNLQVTN